MMVAGLRLTVMMTVDFKDKLAIQITLLHVIIGVNFKENDETFKFIKHVSTAYGKPKKTAHGNPKKESFSLPISLKGL